MEIERFKVYFDLAVTLTYAKNVAVATMMTNSQRELSNGVQWVPELLERVDLFHVNKSCKIEHCVNKTHQIIQNMILSRGLELKVSLF